nr:MAG TPA: hypothetical protein [Caudoviricetes sp.]DAT61879.1 MAG TPA: hypothetical protein [Caudoviricetes sp.]
MPPERNVVRVHECSRGRFDSKGGSNSPPTP